MIVQKKDIYWQGLIYQGVPDGMSRYNYTSYPVQGNHSFTDGMDVTGMYELKYQWKQFGGDDVFVFCDEGQYNLFSKDTHLRRIVALSAPPVPGDGAEAKGEILANNDKPEYIICAAIHFLDGEKYEHQPRNIIDGFVVCGRRHHNCFLTKSLLKFSELKGQSIQGFLTSKDIFVPRNIAGRIAFDAKQISEPTDCLFSEDLY